MKTTKTTTTGIKVVAGIKAGGWSMNHNFSTASVRVKSGLKAGAGIFLKNHSASLISATAR